MKSGKMMTNYNFCSSGVLAATDRQIDQLVYKLYGLTDEEIKIVKGR
jgi:hypothetical protein